MSPVQGGTHEKETQINTVQISRLRHGQCYDQELCLSPAGTPARSGSLTIIAVIKAFQRTSESREQAGTGPHRVNNGLR